MRLLKCAMNLIFVICVKEVIRSMEYGVVMSQNYSLLRSLPDSWVKYLGADVCDLIWVNFTSDW